MCADLSLAANPQAGGGSVKVSTHPKGHIITNGLREKLVKLGLVDSNGDLDIPKLLAVERPIHLEPGIYGGSVTSLLQFLIYSTEVAPADILTFAEKHGKSLSADNIRTLLRRGLK